MSQLIVSQIDCDEAWLSVENIVKKAMVILPDGSFAFQNYNISATAQSESGSFTEADVVVQNDGFGISHRTFPIQHNLGTSNPILLAVKDNSNVQLNIGDTIPNSNDLFYIIIDSPSPIIGTYTWTAIG